MSPRVLHRPRGTNGVSVQKNQAMQLASPTCSPFSARRYRSQVSFSGGTGSLGSLCCKAKVRPPWLGDSFPFSLLVTVGGLRFASPGVGLPFCFPLCCSSCGARASEDIFAADERTKVELAGLKDLDAGEVRTANRQYIKTPKRQDGATTAWMKAQPH